MKMSEDKSTQKVQPQTGETTTKKKSEEQNRHKNNVGEFTDE